MSFLPPRALYVHVPLCAARCAYCDFHSLPRGSLEEGASAALVAGTLARAHALAGRFREGAIPAPAGFETVYVGGGTPTALPRAEFRTLLGGLARLAGSPREFTVEANPESLDAEALDAMRDAGVTRLSLGVQSLDPEALAVLGRIAGPREIGRALELAAGRGLALSADLIAGLPRRGGLAGEAASLLDRGVGHLSVYDLVLEAGTPLASRAERGDWAALGEDEAEDERERLEAFLAERGFRRYEVSNYAPPGAESLHNLAYWRMDSYLGAGPGAVSTLAAGGDLGGAALRIEETRELRDYASRAASAAREEPIVPREAAFEVIMMAFRTCFGLDTEAFRRRFGLGLEELVGKSLAAWSERLVPGLEDPLGPPKGQPASGARLALDPRGLDLLNRFLADCLGELEAAYTKKS